VYYILHGEDEFTRSEQVKELCKKMGDAQFADLNITLLDGKKTTMSELAHACNAMPFLLDKRMVIVDGLLTRLEGRRKKGETESEESSEPEKGSALAKELVAYLEHLPETTRLIFVEPKTLAKNNAVLKSAEKDKRGAYVKEFATLQPHLVPKWIQNRVRAKGGKMELAAVEALATHVGTNLRLLDNEIEKLITYRGRLSITTEDVHELVFSVQESNVFDLVDALGKKESEIALTILHEQLNHNAVPQQLFALIVRQFRLLLQMKDLASRGMTVDAARDQLKMHPFVASKIWRQALNYTLPRLEEIFRRLLDTDIALKTGRSEPVVALDALIVELTQ
jgi:DNA polymerase III subunit delta